jgi:hypothetical protein
VTSARKAASEFGVSHHVGFSAYHFLAVVSFHAVIKTITSAGLFSPPLTPCLNPCGFFLWAFLEEKSFPKKPVTLIKLRAMIIQLCSEIEEDECHRAITNISVGLEEVIRKLEVILNMCSHEKTFQGLKNQDLTLCDIWPTSKSCVKHFSVSSIHASPYTKEIV